MNLREKCRMLEGGLRAKLGEYHLKNIEFLNHLDENRLKGKSHRWSKNWRYEPTDIEEYKAYIYLKLLYEEEWKASLSGLFPEEKTFWAKENYEFKRTLLEAWNVLLGKDFPL